MPSLNQQLFSLINTPAAHGDRYLSALAVFLADWLIWIIPLTLIGGWLLSERSGKQEMVRAALAGICALMASAAIGYCWPQPRPFMLALGRQLIAHAADASLPSDHLTLWWAVALSLACSSRYRAIGLLLTCMGVPVAWARIYAGVHFPLDMAAAWLVAWLAAILMMLAEPLVAQVSAVILRLCRMLDREH
jgi:undecaprenyl-diphosphatase